MNNTSTIIDFRKRYKQVLFLLFLFGLISIQMSFQRWNLPALISNETVCLLLLIVFLFTAVVSLIFSLYYLRRIEGNKGGQMKLLLFVLAMLLLNIIAIIG